MNNVDHNGFSVDMQAISICDIKEVAARTDIHAVCQELLKDGELRGNEWWSRNPRRADSQIGSFSVNLQTGKAYDFADDTKTSDIVGTVAHVLGINPYSAKDWIVNKGLITNKRRVIPEQSNKPSPQTALWAKKIFEQAQEIDFHEYLDRKQVSTHTPYLRHVAVDVIKQITGWSPKSNKKPSELLIGDCIIAPIYQEQQMVSLELIDKDGRKSALPGENTKKNGFWMPAALPDNDGMETLYIGEGIATTLTVFMAKSEDREALAVAALSQGNIFNLVKFFRKKYPNRPIRVCADQIKGTQEIDAKILTLADLPNVSVVKPSGTHKDFNDLMVAEGFSAVQAALSQPISASSLIQAAIENDAAFDVDLSNLDTAELKPIEYLIEPFFPRGHTTLFGGHGGTGKSLLALTMACHVACGQEWAGLPTTQGKVLFVSMEDDGDLLRFRLKRIALEYQLSYQDIAENLRVIDGSEWGALATEVNVNGVKSIEMTDNAKRVARLAVDRDLVFIDNASDAFEGNENERRQVRKFVKELTTMIKPHHGALVLLAHVDKVAARGSSQGNTYSGSTAWHNSARSRLALILNENETLKLVHEKLNVGKKLKDAIDIEWTAGGVPIPVSVTMQEHAESLTASIDDDAIVEAMRMAARNGESIPVAMTGPRTTINVLMAYPPVKNAFSKGDGKTRFRTAMVRLDSSGRIQKSVEINANRKQREYWVLAEVATVTSIAVGQNSAAAGGQKRPWEA